ncbi:MAG TPA: DUF6304 family protein [Actinocrinis sp.]|nr:DUF6304 family protein [Actinocrinis sp.]
MKIPWPARFSDAFGSEQTSITRVDGPNVGLRIRGFDFFGLPSDLQPVQPLPPDARVALSDNGYLRNYVLEWRVPVLLDHASGTTQDGCLYLRLEEVTEIAAVLRTGGAEYRARWIQDRSDEALGDLRENLPADLRLRSCHSCALAEYPAHAYFDFGSLGCFRDTPDEVLGERVSLWGLWPKLTELVSETYLCPQHQPGGHRGVVGNVGVPNLWTVDHLDEPLSEAPPQPE